MSINSNDLVKCTHCGHRLPRSETRLVENPNSFTDDMVCKNEVECASRFDAKMDRANRANAENERLRDRDEVIELNTDFGMNPEDYDLSPEDYEL